MTQLAAAPRRNRRKPRQTRRGDQAVTAGGDGSEDGSAGPPVSEDSSLVSPVSEDSSLVSPVSEDSSRASRCRSTAPRLPRCWPCTTSRNHSARSTRSRQARSSYRRRGARVAGRERRGQVHHGQDPGRGVPARLGRMLIVAAPVTLHSPAARGRRDRRHLPGADALPRPDGRGEHIHGTPPLVAGRRIDRRRMQAESRPCSRAWESSSTQAGSAVGYPSRTSSQ